MAPSAMPRGIAVATALHLTVGLLLWSHWMLTGNFVLVQWYFDYPVELFLILGPGAQVLAARMVSRQFSPGEPMKRAWSLLSFSAALQAAGALVVHGFATRASWSPFQALGGSPPEEEVLRKAGMFVAGPVAVLILGFALHYMLKLSSRCGIRPRWRAGDALVVATGAAALGRHCAELASILGSNVRVDWLTTLNWASDPVLMYVLVITMRLLQSARELGGGLVAGCWRAYAAGVMLFFLGDLGLSASVYSTGIWPWNSLFWYVWVPAAGAFAAAPALYWAAISEAAELAGPAESRRQIKAS